MKTQSHKIPAIALAVFFASLVGAIAHAENHSFNEVAIEVGGTKFWLPSTLTVKKGDHVKIHAVSKTGAPHGFSIPAFKVEAVADEKGKDVEFTADKAGVFPINCQLHPAHIGGQLVVIE